MELNKKITKANNVKKIGAVYKLLSEALSVIDALNYVKIYNGRIKASNRMSVNGKREPITSDLEENITGVELLIDTHSKTIQFYSITSSVKGTGSKIVSSVVDATPDDWKVVVLMDWSGGFWNVMAERHPRLILL